MVRWLNGCFFFKQKTAYEMRISDWSSDVCASDLFSDDPGQDRRHEVPARRRVAVDSARGVGQAASRQAWRALLHRSVGRQAGGVRNGDVHQDRKSVV